VHIRKAIIDDNAELQQLQAQCPMGTQLVVSIVNTPDFFARAKAYESYEVFVATEEGKIIGSAACAIRQAIVDGKVSSIGYEFQYFTHPECRRKGVARQLHNHIEDYLISKDAVLSYLIIMEGNVPSMKFFEGQGFKLYRTLVMPGLAVHKEMKCPQRRTIRPAVPNDLSSISKLLNQMWKEYVFYEPASAETLARFINRTPAYDFDNLIILEDANEILACLGFWDWSHVMRITVIERNLKMQIMGFLLDVAGFLRPMPRVPRPLETLRQWCLTPIGFKDTDHLQVLLRYVNNQAVTRGIKQIFFVCERNHELLRSTKGFIRADTLIHSYAKVYQESATIGTRRIFIDGIDL